MADEPTSDALRDGEDEARGNADAENERADRLHDAADTTEENETRDDSGDE